MSSRRSRGRSMDPPEPPPPPSEPGSDVDDPPTDSVDSPRPRVDSSAAIDQSSINEAVMKAFSDPGVLRTLVSAIQSSSSASSDSGPGATPASVAADGTSPLGELPHASEVASLGLPITPSSSVSREDPLLAPGASTAPASATAGLGKDPCSVVYSGRSKSTESVVSSISGFSLGHGFPLIPAKLVTKILKWEYVRMADLLPDNLELARRSQTEVQRSASCSAKSPKKQELSEDWKGLVAWSVSFSTFIAVIASKHPEKSQELLAYHATVLIEALRFGCKGWLSYDKMFRENMEKEPHSPWAMLHPMFYSLTFLSQRVDALTCPRCMAPDHSKSECALASLDPLPEPGRIRQASDSRQPGPSRKRFRREGTPTSSASGPSSGRVAYCFSYNEGQCFRYPRPCEREHRCIRCGKEHRLVDCKATFVGPVTSTAS